MWAPSDSRGNIMLPGFIGLFIVYALAHYWITMNKRDFGATLLVIALPFVGVYYLGWMALLYCLAAAYLGTKAGLKKLQRAQRLRTSFYEDTDEPRQ
jgi:apolipoprotein N-acyltransferase